MILILNDNDVIAQGSEKLIFRHPQDASKLIKVSQPGYDDKLVKKHPLLSKVTRFKKFWFFLNQFIEYLYLNEVEPESTKYVEAIRGTVHTNLGLGFVVDALLCPDGSIAPTLRQLVVGQQFTQQHKTALTQMIHCLSQLNVIIRDPSLDNLVWNESNQCFVLVDGIGNNFTPSFRSLLFRYNQRRNKQKFAKVWKRIKTLQQAHA